MSSKTGSIRHLGIQHDSVCPTRIGLLTKLIHGITSPNVALPPTTTLPPMFHFALLHRLDTRLSFDGYDADHAPPSFDAMRRRLLVSGSLRVTRSLAVDRDTRVAQTLSLARVAQRMGTPFVTVARDIVDAGCGELAILDERTLAYPLRGPLRAGSGGNTYPTRRTREVKQEAFSRKHAVSEVQAFQYSALTFNSHLIHYNRDYAREEGYTDVVVPGTLLATIASTHVLNYTNAKEPAISMNTFKYSFSRPVHVNEEFVVSGDGESKVWIETASQPAEIIMRAGYGMCDRMELE
ncbi:hypothetical protein BC830DRAFT_1106478 [Chytriomyces sp. MP71]|nr:hypothetical protein BC830DRAFT_1106478 [Chytriomyces sp. MP71]